MNRKALYLFLTKFWRIVFFSMSCYTILIKVVVFRIHEIIIMMNLVLERGKNEV